MRIGLTTANFSRTATVHENVDSQARCSGREIKQFIGASHSDLVTAARYGDVVPARLCVKCFTEADLLTVWA